MPVLKSMDVLLPTCHSNRTNNLPNDYKVILEPSESNRVLRSVVLSTYCSTTSQDEARLFRIIASKSLSSDASAYSSERLTSGKIIFEQYSKILASSNAGHLASILAAQSVCTGLDLIIPADHSIVVISNSDGLQTSKIAQRVIMSYLA